MTWIIGILLAPGAILLCLMLCGGIFGSDPDGPDDRDK